MTASVRTKVVRVAMHKGSSSGMNLLNWQVLKNLIMRMTTQNHCCMSKGKAMDKPEFKSK